MLSDIVGTSVLTFTGVANKLGWVLTIVFIVGLFPVSVYVSVLMSRTRQLILKTASFQKGCWAQEKGLGEAPVGTMGEVAGSAFQQPAMGTIVEFIVYVYVFLGQASYLLVLGTNVQVVVQSSSFCLTWATAIACLCMAGPFVALRQLSDSVLICFLNTLLIAAVIVLALVMIGRESTEETRGIAAMNPDLNFNGALGAGTNVVYSYAGQWMYFELMDTMTKPTDFPHAFLVAGPFMVISYLTVALVGTYLGATHSDLIADIPMGNMLSFIGTLLFVHVAIVYLIKGVVIARFLLKKCSPVDLDARTATSYLKHGSWACAMLVAGWILANAIPFFSQFLGLIGGLLAGPINFLLPIVLFIAAQGHFLKVEKETSNVELSEAATEETEDRSTDESSDSDLDNSGFCMAALQSLPAWELVAMTAIATFVALTMVFGVYSEIAEILRLENEFGAPFTCHPLDMAKPGNNTGQ